MRVRDTTKNRHLDHGQTEAAVIHDGVQGAPEGLRRLRRENRTLRWGWSGLSAYQKRKTASIITTIRRVRHEADISTSAAVIACGGFEDDAMRLMGCRIG
jgi:hypothetical protein